MAERVVALVPLRDPGTGKTRLSPALDTAQRARLAAAMLADVAAALRLADVDEVVVAAAGPDAAAAAAALDLPALVDPEGTRTLDDAVRAAVGRLRGVDAVLTVAADLPRLTTADVSLVLDHDTDVVVAPTGDGGTGGLLRRPPEVIPTAYGTASARRHRRLADLAGATITEVTTPGFRDDIDTIADLVALRRGGVGPATAAVLPALLGPAADAG